MDMFAVFVRRTLADFSTLNPVPTTFWARASSCRILDLRYSGIEPMIVNVQYVRNGRIIALKILQLVFESIMGLILRRRYTRDDALEIDCWICSVRFRLDFNSSPRYL